MAALTRRALGLLALVAVAGCAGLPLREQPPEGGPWVLCAGPAERVVAMGSFDGWGAGVALEARPDGNFGGAIALPEGVSEVVCRRWIAGGAVETAAPLNAIRVVDDGFGGSNGVFDLTPGGGRAEDAADDPQ